MEKSENKIITQDFMEKVLGKKLNSFKVKAGSKDGDNYSSVIYTVDVNYDDGPSSEGKKSKTKDEYILTKCYPSNPARQDLLIKMNAFWKEISIYETWIPELERFQVEMGVKEIIKPDFAPYVAGHAVNFVNKNSEGDCVNHVGRYFEPLENYVMLTDIRKTWGFRMADRCQPQDIHHVSLVVEALARVHALSWAYKQNVGSENLTKDFPFLEYDITCTMLRVLMTNMIQQNGKLGVDTLQKLLCESSPLVQGTKTILEHVDDVFNIIYDGKNAKATDFEKWLRVTPKNKEDNSPEINWKVVIHGDCWTNNMLFHYNEETGKPDRVILVDLQICRETCLTTDLVYFFYTSTDSVLRRKHMSDLLSLYVQKFEYVCGSLNCEPPADFNLAELTRRFHRAKVYGYYLGLLGLPLMLVAEENTVDMEQVEGENIQDMILKASSEGINNNKVYEERLLDLAQDVYDDGII